MSFFAALALLAATAAPPSLPCAGTLAPRLSRRLPVPPFAQGRTVAWGAGGRLLIGTGGGIVAYDLTTTTATPLVPGRPIPNGIAAVVGLDSDGSHLVAFNADYSDLTADVRTGRITSARREFALQIADVAIRGDVVAVLGFPLRLKTADFAQLWIGKAGEPWSTNRPLHPVTEASEEIVRYSIAPNGGAVTFLKDGTIAMISPAEPGLFRYRADGTPLPVLGADLRELVVPRMREAIFGYRLDVEGRYREIFNRQPTIDDLVDTPDGPAVVVRRWSDGAAGWELWFPGPQRVRRRVVLGIRDAGVAGGDLKCATRGSSLACVFDRITGRNQPPLPELAIFDLAQVQRCR